MILLNITPEDQEQSEKIAHLLLSKSLAIDLTIIEQLKTVQLDQNENLLYKKGILLQGKTKALLFPTIDQLLRKHFPSNMPVLFSTAIVNMDWEQAEQLVKEIEKV